MIDKNIAGSEEQRFLRRVKELIDDDNLASKENLMTDEEYLYLQNEIENIPSIRDYLKDVLRGSREIIRDINRDDLLVFQAQCSAWSSVLGMMSIIKDEYKKYPRLKNQKRMTKKEQNAGGGTG